MLSRPIQMQPLYKRNHISVSFDFSNFSILMAGFSLTYAFFVPEFDILFTFVP